MTAEDRELMAVLLAVQHGDEEGSPLDNAGVARACGISVETARACLDAAKERSLIWGMRTGHGASASYTDLEVTVQGRRFLTSNSSQS